MTDNSNTPIKEDASNEIKQYALCPLCLEKNEVIGFSTQDMSALSGHFIAAHTRRTGERWEDYKESVIYTDEVPPNLATKEKKPRKGSPPKKTSASRGDVMTEIDPKHLTETQIAWRRRLAPSAWIERFIECEGAAQGPSG